MSLTDGLKGTTDAIISEMNKLNQKEKEIITGYEKKIPLIDYETSQHPELLNAKKLCEDIKSIDKKSIEYLIVKCQRLYLISKHKLYKKLDYQNAEEYALKEHKIKRIQLYKYVYIFEKLEKKLLNAFENVQSTKHVEELSIEKLYIISKLEEENQIDKWFNEVLEKNMSVTELKKELVKNKLISNNDANNKKSFEENIILFNRKLPKRKLTDTEINLIDDLIKDLILLKNK